MNKSVSNGQQRKTEIVKTVERERLRAKSLVVFTVSSHSLFRKKTELRKNLKLLCTWDGGRRFYARRTEGFNLLSMSMKLSVFQYVHMWIWILSICLSLSHSFQLIINLIWNPKFVNVLFKKKTSSTEKRLFWMNECKNAKF